MNNGPCGVLGHERRREDAVRGRNGADEWVCDGFVGVLLVKRGDWRRSARGSGQGEGGSCFVGLESEAHLLERLERKIVQSEE